MDAFWVGWPARLCGRLACELRYGTSKREVGKLVKGSGKVLKQLLAGSLRLLTLLNSQAGPHNLISLHFGQQPVILSSELVSLFLIYNTGMKEGVINATASAA